MTDPDGPRFAFRGRLLAVELRPHPEGVREVIHHPGAVAVLVLDPANRVLAVRQHREGAGQALWEIPAGVLEPGERPLKAAQRELEEETGLEGGRWKFLALLYPSPGYAAERIYLFSVTDWTGRPAPRSEIEALEFLSPEEIFSEARKGRGDAKTLAALAFLGRVQAT